MHIVMENRARRDSTRSTSIPDPLILDKGLGGCHSALQTPPPSAPASKPTDDRPCSSKTLFPNVATTFQMPYTPLTPRTPADMKMGPRSFTLSQSRTEQTELREESLSEASDQHTSTDLHRPKQSSSMTNKRSREAEAEADCESAPRPIKRFIREADLIGNPFLALRRCGIPERYTIRHMNSVAAKFFNNQDGASVHIRARSAANPKRPRVKVIPQDSVDESFYLHFRSNTNEEVVTESSGKAELATKSTAVSPDMSEIMPLHIEVALLRAPLLGQLLLSGHVYRGDMLEIELPHPDLLYDVMQWMYTGVTNVTRKEDIKSCIDFLNGR